MRIISLILKNFKGIKELTITANGRNVNIFGENATGKTTIADAFNWLLNGKDSLNRSDFGIKPIDPDTQEPIHGIETSVEGALSLGEAKTIILKKVYYEKWVKERGAAERVFSGNTTDYFINNIPVKKGEYEEEIKKIADEKAFKLLTNPLFYNEQLHWTDRRKMLLQVCGDISDSEVIETNSKLAALIAILGNNTIEQHKKLVSAAKAKINEELEKIPIRITEVKNSVQDTTGIVVDALTKEIEVLRKQQDGYRQESIRITTGGEIAEKNKRLAEINAELLNLRTAHEQKKADALKELVRQEGEVSTAYRDFCTNRDIKKSEIDSADRAIAALDVEIDGLYEKWDKVDAETFTYRDFELTQESVCPACGQAIPEETLSSVRSKALDDYNVARDKAEASFNLDKSTRLEAIAARGKAAKAERDAKSASLETLNNQHTELVKKADAAKSKLDVIRQQIQNTQSGFQDVAETAEYKTKAADIALVKAEITALQNGNAGRITELAASVSEIDAQISALQSKINVKEQADKAKARIGELLEDEKRLAKEYERLEGELFLTEEFIRTKVKMLDSKINGRFKYVRFKLFNQQVNGALDETCEALINTNGCWTPYSDANAAGKINGGIDIINTLSEFYGFEAPIFIDNSESVVNLAETKAQIFRLVVSGQDRALRVEIAQ
jgi:AAA15 family ATPase/GTPase